MLRAFLLALLVVAAAPAHAHHVTDFLMSTPPGGGDQLIIAWPFDAAVAPLSFDFALGDTTVFSGTNPGFDAADGDEFLGSLHYRVFTPGTEIGVELVDNDGGRTAMKLNGKTLAVPGDATVLGVAGDAPPGDLHHHPEWLLYSTGPAGAFAEGHISFRLTTTTPGLEPSPVYTVRLTNGHLPPPDYAADRYDGRSVACQQAVGRAVDPYVHAVYQALRRCLDRLAVVRARLVASLAVDAAGSAAGRVCAPMVDKLDRLRARSAAGIARACGAHGSTDFTDEEIAQHLGLARCRAEETAAASYFRAQTLMKPFAAHGKPLLDAFPCVVRTSGEEEGRS